MILGGVVLVLVSGLIGFARLLDVNAYRGHITRQLEQRLGRSVSLGNLELSLFPSVIIKAADPGIADDPQFNSSPFVQARSVRLNIGFWSLLTGDPEVRNIELTEPTVVLVKEKDGRWNWSTLTLLTEEAAKTDVAPMDITIRDGRFTLVNRHQSSPTEKTYTGVQADIKNFSSRSASDFKVAITLPGQQKGQLSMDGTFGPVDPSDIAQSPMDARVSMQQAELASLETLLGQASSHQGRLTLNASLKGRLKSGVQIQGDMKAEQLRLADGVEPADWPVVATFALVATAQEKSYLVDVTSCQWTLGKTQATMTGQINQIPINPTAALRVKGDAVALDSLLESAHAFGFGPPRGTSVSGQANMDVHINGPLDAMTLSGRSDIQNLKLQSAELPQPIHVSQLSLAFDPDAVTVSPFRTTLGDRTSVEITSLSIRDYRRQPLARLDVATQNAKLEDLLKIAGSFGYRTAISGAGTVNVKATIETNLADANSRPKIAGQGQIAGGRISHENMTATDLQADIKLQGQTVDLNPLTCGIYGGRYSGRLTLTGAGPDIALSGNFNGVDVNQFLSATSSLKNTVYGQTSGTLNLRGRGQQADSLLRTLAGQGRLTLADGRITSFNLVQQIAAIGKLVGLSAGGSETRFRQFSTNYRIAGGRLVTDGLKWDLNQIVVTGRGGLQLASPNNTDYDLRAQLTPALTRTVIPGGNILSTAGNYFLSGQMVVVPIKMSGPLRQPRFSLDSGVLRDNLIRVPKQPVEAVKDVLDIFKKKPKEKP
jgi:uncharacterized protein involved in outer membrane biogenesis